MDLSLFPRGLVIGFAIAAPVGPIGVLVIRRTLAYGRLAGLASGLGAATADAFYGLLAAFGLTFVSRLLVGHSAPIRLAGGLFLCYLGASTLRAPPLEEEPSGTANRVAGAYLSTALLTVANPATILSFAAVFAGLGLASSGGYRSAMVLVAGVFCGSGAWWLMLSSAMSTLRGRLSPGALRWVNVTSGALILAFGLAALGSVVVSTS